MVFLSLILFRLVCYTHTFHALLLSRIHQLAGPYSQQEVGVLLEVRSEPVLGALTTTFTLSSEPDNTRDTDNGNNEAMISLTVDRRADLKVSLYVSGTSDKGPSEIGTTSLQRTLVAAPC